MTKKNTRIGAIPLRAPTNNTPNTDNHTNDDLLDEADSINGFHKSIHNRLQYLIRLHKTMNSVVYRREIINPHRKDICHYITNIVIIQ